MPTAKYVPSPDIAAPLAAPGGTVVGVSNLVLGEYLGNPRTENSSGYDACRYALPSASNHFGSNARL